MSKVIKEYYVDRDVRSRYADDKRLVFDNGEYCIETPDRISFKRSNQDRMYTVDAGFENRLDLIAWKVYGSAQWWWVIANASGIVDPFDVPIGTVLTVPPLISVQTRRR